MKKLLTFFFLTCSLLTETFAGVDFDGNDYVDTNYTAGSTGNFSWGGWFELDGTPVGEDEIMGVQTADPAATTIQTYFLDSLTPNCLCADAAAQSGYDNIASNTAVTAGVPFHIMCTLNTAGSLIIYLNGTNTGSITVTSACDSATKNLDIDFAVGARNDGTAGFENFIDGKVYEAYFYNAELTAAQVSLLASRKKRIPCEILLSSLQKYFPLDEGAGGTSSANVAVNNMCGSDTDTGLISNTTNTWFADRTLNYPVSIIQGQ